MTYDKNKLKDIIAIQRFIMLHENDDIFKNIDMYELLGYLLDNKEDIGYLIGNQKDKNYEF